MRLRTPNFSDAKTLLDWADRQINVFADEVAEFTSTDPYTITTKAEAEGWTHVFLATSISPTDRLGPSVNAIIQAQRSSLDYVAVALAEANGATNPTDTYFPIVQTKEGLFDKRTLKKIRSLDSADQKIITDLKPYAGGNDTLFALHILNVERKHRRLGLLAAGISPVGIRGGSGGLKFDEVWMFKPQILSKDPSLIAMLQFEGEMKIQIATDITFRDVPGPQSAPSVIPTLHHFGATCRAIIDLFH